MRALALIIAATALSACGQAQPQSQTIDLPEATQPLADDVYDALNEPSPSDQALFVAEHSDEYLCDTPERMHERLESEGFRLVSIANEYTEWVAHRYLDSNGNALTVEVSAMESCIF